MGIPDIVCSGTPREIGLIHGREARQQIHGSIAFYTGMFQRTAKLSWSAVQDIALEKFEPVLRAKCPRYLEEMEGIAEGASVPLSSIISLNARTEIAFGLFSDGCTSLAWKAADNSYNYIAQNWDWMPAQAPNLIRLTIHQPSLDLPAIKIITEGGLIGKIGLNSAGVGVCFNAIRAHGVSFDKLPAHVALRIALESKSRDEAVEAIERAGGLAASCFLLISDGKAGGLGIEWSSVDNKKLVQDGRGRVTHANHYVLEHPGVVDTKWLADSDDRDERIKVLCGELEGRDLKVEDVRQLFQDRQGAPKSIAKTSVSEIESGTLFNIVMDLKKVKAYVRMGVPSEPPEEEFVFEF